MFCDMSCMIAPVWISIATGLVTGNRLAMVIMVVIGRFNRYRYLCDIWLIDLVLRSSGSVRYPYPPTLAPSANRPTLPPTFRLLPPSHPLGAAIFCGTYRFGSINTCLQNQRCQRLGWRHTALCNKTILQSAMTYSILFLVSFFCMAGSLYSWFSLQRFETRLMSLDHSGGLPASCRRRVLPLYLKGQHDFNTAICVLLLQLHAPQVNEYGYKPRLRSPGL